jgi:formimidoylglutamate deiminase
VDDVLGIAADLRSEYARDPDVVIGACAHSLRAVTPQELAALVAGSPKDVPIHLHVAEQEREVEAVRAGLGARPVEWLLANADVGARWTLVHATHVNAEETEALARSGATVALAPTTEANLGDGIFPLRAFLDHGGAFAVGSDSNVSIDVGEELRWLEYGQRLVAQRRNVAAVAPGESSGEALYRRAAHGGAHAAGRLGGAIVAGSRADLVFIESSPETGDEVLDRYVFASQPKRPSRTMVSGTWANG